MPVKFVRPLVFILLLTACGADGAPTPPAGKVVPEPGITVSGDAYVGMVID
jgi:hypothetical protein